MPSEPRPPTGSAMRRALRRAGDGVALDAAEASRSAAGPRRRPATDLLAAASAVRDAGSGQRRPVGSRHLLAQGVRAVTRLCRDRCHYCTFVQTPAQLARAGRRLFLTPDEVLRIARQGAALGLQGGAVHPRRPPGGPLAAGARSGWRRPATTRPSGTCARSRSQVLEATGLLPHVNAGVMSWQELGRMKPVSPSIGMMLETSSRRLFETPGLAHHGSPDKDPAVRLRDDRGRRPAVGPVHHRHPRRHRRDLRRARRQPLRAASPGPSVRAPAGGHRPELPRQAGDGDARGARPRAGGVPGRRRRGPARARAPACGSRCRPTCPRRRAGSVAGGRAPTTGAASPRSPPTTSTRSGPGRTSTTSRPWSAEAGFTLTERLTVHPEYVRAGEPWLDPRVAGHVRGARRPGHRAGAAAGGAGRASVAGARSADGGAAAGSIFIRRSTPTGRTGDRRGDFDVVYGDWAALREQAAVRRGVPAPGRRAATVAAAAALRLERTDPEVGRAARVERAQATAHRRDGRALAGPRTARRWRARRLADELRREVVGDEVTYVVNRNLNFTNVCYTGCRFCAFAQRRRDADAFTLSLRGGRRPGRGGLAVGAPPRSACRAGSIPSCPATAYFDLARAVMDRVPGMHVHAFSPMEVVNGVTRTGLPLREWLDRAKERGSARCRARRPRSSTTTSVGC